MKMNRNYFMYSSGSSFVTVTTISNRFVTISFVNETNTLNAEIVHDLASNNYKETCYNFNRLLKLFNFNETIVDAALIKSIRTTFNVDIRHRIQIIRGIDPTKTLIELLIRAIKAELALWS